MARKGSKAKGAAGGGTATATRGSLPDAFTSEELGALDEEPTEAPAPVESPAEIPDVPGVEEFEPNAEPETPQTPDSEPTPEPSEQQEEAAPAEEPIAEAGAELSQETKDLARMLNVSEAELSRFPDPVSAQNALLMIAARQQAPPQAPAQQVQTQVPVQQPVQQQQAAQQPAEQEFAKYELKLDDDYLDEATAKQIAGMNEHYHAEAMRSRNENAQLRNVVSELIGHQRQLAGQVAQAEVARFHAWCNGLGPEWEPVVGKGIPEEGTQAYANRVRIANQVGSFRQVCALTGKPAPQGDAEFFRAARDVFPKHEKTLARREVMHKIRDQKGRFAAMPDRKVGEPDPMKAHLDKMEAILRPAGLGTREDEEPDPKI
ncbi:MAG: hypothetical protein ACE5FM_04785 [Methyloligellaceae bacterium]